MDKVAWKAYEEVDFSNKYILRWVREGDEYVNKITKEMMEDLKSVVRQQQAEIEALKERIAFLEDKAVMVDYEPVDHQFSYKALMGEDMVEAQMRINNLLRQMVDDLPTKDKP